MVNNVRAQGGLGCALARRGGVGAGAWAARRAGASCGLADDPQCRHLPSPRIAPLVAAVEARLSAALGTPLATLAVPLDSRVSVVRTQEAALGNLAVDALRAHLRADVALINGGGLRGNREYPVGHVFTRRDLLGEMPFGNSVVALESDRRRTPAMLEHGLAEVADAAGRFPQVSGLNLVYDPQVPAGQRLRELRIGGVAVNPARRYRLATTDIHRGGDGYDMPGRCACWWMPVAGRCWSMSRPRASRPRVASPPASRAVSWRARFPRRRRPPHQSVARPSSTAWHATIASPAGFITGTGLAARIGERAARSGRCSPRGGLIGLGTSPSTGMRWCGRSFPDPEFALHQVPQWKKRGRP